MSEPWPRYLVVGGTEVANAARTLTYMRSSRGRAVGFDVPRDPVELMWPLYVRSGVTEFTDPATDNAPWYAPDVDQSTRFLGLLLNPPPAFDSPSRRDVVQMTEGGAFGVEQLLVRTIAFSGNLIALDTAGAAYGLRWLANVLADLSVSGPVATAQIYDHMPPNSDVDEGFWTLNNVQQSVGLVAGVRPDCPFVTPVTFTIVAADSMLYQEPGVLYAPTVIDLLGTVGGQCIGFDTWLQGPGSPPLSADVAPPGAGEVGVIIQVSSPNGVNAVMCEAVNDRVANQTDNAWFITKRFPPGSSWQFDAARKQITYIDPTGNTSDGTNYLVLDASRGIPWEWFKLAWYDNGLTVSVHTPAPYGYGAGATVAIQTEVRTR